MSAPSAEVAVRNPRGGGKAHRVVLGGGSPNTPRSSWPDNWTACRRYRIKHDLTVRVPVGTLDPADPCRRCWPDLATKETT